MQRADLFGRKKLPTKVVLCLDGGQDCVGLLVHLGVEAGHHAFQAAVVLVQAPIVMGTWDKNLACTGPTPGLQR